MKKQNKKLLVILLIIAALAFIALIINRLDLSEGSGTAVSAQPQPKAQITITAEDEKMMKDMIASNLVEKIDVQMNEGWVDPIVWAGMKYEDKKHLGWFLANYCGKKKGNNLNYVEIKDSYSGKTLAKYSESWGFKVY